MVLGLFGSKEADAFLGPTRKGLSEQLMVTPGSTASAPFTVASSFPRPRTAEVAGAGTLATKAFWVLSLLAGACSFRKTAASRSTLQHKLRCCTVACRAGELPPPVVFHLRTPLVKEPNSAVATTAPPPLPAQTTEHRAAAHRATLVGGARCTATARSAARRARQRKAAERTAASSAVRRAVGSRLQATSC